MQNPKEESPEYLQTSTAGALALRFQRGNFYRNAKLYCLNLLLTYESGCRANCAFCGLGRERKSTGSERDKTFIRVEWPIYKTELFVKALKSDVARDIRRECISMVTHPRAREDTLIVARELGKTGKDLSVLLAPTIINKSWLEELKQSTPVEKVGIAIDAATPELFDKLRGKGVKGPHSWKKYWEIFQQSIDIFDPDHASIHLIIGIGETEKEAINIIQKVHDMGSDTHLFSFFPEPGSAMENHAQPGIGTYRRIQLAREAIHQGLTSINKMQFNESGQIIDFGLSKNNFNSLIDNGIAFCTQGCKDDKDGFITCNRPYSNSTPFQAAKGELRNFPFIPNENDKKIIKKQLNDYDPDSWIRPLDSCEDFIIEEDITKENTIA
ncbi:MAG: radical SAM protein [Promethearchaeota archaeon]